MDVSSLLATTTPQKPRAEAKSGPSTLGYDNFLQLLLTQMKNQDPTAPMESTDYMAQLATFSQVEQQTKTNSKLDALLTSSALSQADSLIGRTITSADGSMSGVVASVRVFSDGILATTKDGKEIAIGAGVTVSE